MQFLDKVRSVLTGGPDNKPGSLLSARDGGLDFNTKACFSCDKPFVACQYTNCCTFCLKAYCSNCLAGFVDKHSQWRVVCEYCHHARLDCPPPSKTPLSATETAETVLSLATGVAKGRHDLATCPQALPPQKLQRNRLATRSAMHRTHSKELTKQVHGDLTWNVPLELDPDFGLSLADRDRRLLAQQKQQDHPAAPAEEKQAGGGGPIAGAQQPSEAAPGVTPGADTSSMDEEPLKPELGSAPSKTDMSRLPHSMVDLQTHTLHDTSQRHLLQLITQLLQAEGAAQVDVWAPILLGLAEAAANAVSPTAMAGHGVLDPRHYVKVKRLPMVGRPEDSNMVPAVVCKRNVAHRRMRTQLQWPKVLLLSGSLEPGSAAMGGVKPGAQPERLSRIEALIGTEAEVLKTVLAKILAAGPDVVVVERSAARWLQEELLANNVTLVLGVKSELLERLARSMGTRVVNCVDNLTPACVGVCKEFKVETPMPAGMGAGGLPGLAPQGFATGTVTPGGVTPGGAPPAATAAAGSHSQSVRTLMSFVCAAPVGATVLLRGASPEQLARVKRVARFAVYGAYSLRLENSLLACHITAALASLGNEVRVPSAGGLAAYYKICAAAIADSARLSSNRMPHGVLVCVSPHTSFFDNTLTAECSEGIREAIEKEQEHWEEQRKCAAAKQAAEAAAEAEAAQQAAEEAAAALLAARPHHQHTHSLADGAGAADEVVSALRQLSVGAAELAEAAAAGPQAPEGSHAGVGVGASVLASPAPPAPPLPPAATPGQRAAPSQAHAAASAAWALGAGGDQGGMAAAGAASANAGGATPGGTQQVPKHLTMRYMQGAQLYDWQRIFLSMACRNPKKQLQCEPPVVKRFSLYGAAPMDMPLLHFFHAAAPAPHKRCPAPGCGDGVTGHVRTFAHMHTRITMSCAALAASDALPGEDKQQLWLWMRPKGRGHDADSCIRRIALPPEAASISFGHFLQLACTCEQLSVGGRSLMHDFVRYLGMGRTVMCMYQDRISPYDIVLPRCATTYDMHAQLMWLKVESTDLAQEAEEAFDIIESALLQQPQLHFPEGLAGGDEGGVGSMAASGPGVGSVLGGACGGEGPLPGVPSYKTVLAGVRKDRTWMLELVEDVVQRLKDVQPALPQPAHNDDNDDVADNVHGESEDEELSRSHSQRPGSTLSRSLSMALGAGHEGADKEEGRCQGAGETTPGATPTAQLSAVPSTAAISTYTDVGSGVGGQDVDVEVAGTLTVSVPAESEGPMSPQPSLLPPVTTSGSTHALDTAACIAASLAPPVPAQANRVGGLSAALGGAAAAGGGGPPRAGGGVAGSKGGPDAGCGVREGEATGRCQDWEAELVKGVGQLSALRRRLASSLAFWAALLQNPEHLCKVLCTLAPATASLNPTAGSSQLGMEMVMQARLSIGQVGGSALGCSSFNPRKSMDLPGASAACAAAGAAPEGAQGGQCASTSGTGPSAAAPMLTLQPALSNVSQTSSLGGALAVEGAASGGSGTGASLFGGTPAAQRPTAMSAQLEQESMCGGFVVVPIAPGPNGPIGIEALMRRLLPQRTTSLISSQGAAAASTVGPSCHLLPGAMTIVNWVWGRQTPPQATAPMAGGVSPGAGQRSPQGALLAGGATRGPGLEVQIPQARPAAVSASGGVTPTGGGGKDAAVGQGNASRLLGSSVGVERAQWGGAAGGAHTPVGGASSHASDLGDGDTDDQDYDHDDGEDTEDDEEDNSYRFYGQMGVGRGRHTRRASVADDDDDDSAFYPQGLNTGCGFDDDSDTVGATSQAGSAWAGAPSVGDSVMSVGDKTQQASKALGMPGVAVREAQLLDQGPNAVAQQAPPAGAPARGAPPVAAAGASATVSTFSVATAEAGAATGVGADVGSCASPTGAGKGLPPVPDRRALTTQPTMARRIQQNVKRKLESLVNSGGGTVIARLRMPGRLFLPAGVDGALVPIHDQEPGTVIANTLASIPYAQLLNTATRAVIQELRRVGVEGVGVAGVPGGGLGAGPGQPPSFSPTSHMGVMGMTAQPTPLSFSASDILARQAAAAAETRAAQVGASLQRGNTPPPTDSATASYGVAPGGPLQPTNPTGTRAVPSKTPGGALGPADVHHPPVGFAPPASAAPDYRPEGQAGPGGAGQLPASLHVTGVGFGSGAGAVRPRVEPDLWAQLLWSREPAHVRVLIEDKPPGMPWATTKFEVTVYFAPQFAELRRRVMAGGEAAFIASLTRCQRWAQRGGKSNAYFAKTGDDRFIIKSMSKAERASFLECAPAYLSHMAKTAVVGRRTCLAKILGAFTVTTRPLGGLGARGAKATSAGGGEAVDLDVVVMENCFYNRKVHRIYDLKGSERNRFNEAAAANPHEAREVHLDDNLRRDNIRNPLLVTPDSLRGLEAALFEDTAFLASLGVMDYSLLVGLDREGAVAVAAIIDYVRTYTWDKQLETWVKGSGLLGGNGKEPTIISPKQYMRRFRAAILSYLTVVPASADVLPLLPPDYEWPSSAGARAATASAAGAGDGGRPE